MTRIPPEVIERSLRNSADRCKMCRRIFKENPHLHQVFHRLLDAVSVYDPRNVVILCNECEWWVHRYREMIAFGIER